MNDAVSPEVVMACAIIAAQHAKEPVLIENISSLFAKLRKENVVDVGKVALRRIPRGLYSEDVEAFFGRLLAGGFATARSPLTLNEQGIQLCLEMIEEESQSHPEALRRVTEVLGFDISEIRSLIHQPRPS